MHLLAIGGSDGGISAALRVRELDPDVDVTVMLADAHPNFSICGIPYLISGDVTDWHNLAHRTRADVEATGINLLTDTTTRAIDVDEHRIVATGPDGHDLCDHEAVLRCTNESTRLPPPSSTVSPSTGSTTYTPPLGSPWDVLQASRQTWHRVLPLTADANPAVGHCHAGQRGRSPGCAQGNARRI